MQVWRSVGSAERREVSGMETKCQGAKCGRIITGVKTCIAFDDGPLLVLCLDCARKVIPPREPSSGLVEWIRKLGSEIAGR